jgi:hypothetical protein
MTTFYDDDDVSKGQLKISTGDDYVVNLDDPATVTIGAKVTQPGIVNLSDGNDTVQNSGHGDLTIDLGGGNDTFIQRTGGTHIDVTGGAGNDVLWNIGGGKGGGATADFHYTFTTAGTEVTSQDGQDGINGFQLGRDHLVFDVPAGTVTEANFTSYFNVSDAPGSAGVVITNQSGDGWSVQLIGVHATVQQLLAADAFVFA